MLENEFRVSQVDVLKTLKGKSIEDCISILEKTIKILNVIGMSNQLEFDDDWSKKYIDDASN